MAFSAFSMQNRKSQIKDNVCSGSLCLVLLVRCHGYSNVPVGNNASLPTCPWGSHFRYFFLTMQDYTHFFLFRMPTNHLWLFPLCSPLSLSLPPSPPPSHSSSLLTEERGHSRQATDILSSLTYFLMTAPWFCLATFLGTSLRLLHLQKTWYFH